MYDDGFVQDARRRGEKCVRGLLLAVGVLLAVCVALLVMRQQLAVSLLTLFAGAAILVWWDAVLLPHVMYARYLKDLKASLIKQTDGLYCGCDVGVAVRDGVRFHPLTLQDEEGIERLFYLDERFPLPSIAAGAAVTIEHSGQYVRDIRRQGGEEHGA